MAQWRLLGLVSKGQVTAIWKLDYQNLDGFVQTFSGFDKMAAICLGFKWLGFQTSESIWNTDCMQIDLFLTIQDLGANIFRIPTVHLIEWRTYLAGTKALYMEGWMNVSLLRSSKSFGWRCLGSGHQLSPGCSWREWWSSWLRSWQQHPLIQGTMGKKQTFSKGPFINDETQTWPPPPSSSFHAKIAVHLHLYT